MDATRGHTAAQSVDVHRCSCLLGYVLLAVNSTAASSRCQAALAACTKRAQRTPQWLNRCTHPLPRFPPACMPSNSQSHVHSCGQLSCGWLCVPNASPHPFPHTPCSSIAKEATTGAGSNRMAQAHPAAIRPRRLPRCSWMPAGNQTGWHAASTPTGQPPALQPAMDGGTRTAYVV